MNHTSPARPINEQSKRRKQTFGAILTSILVHAILLGIAASLTIMIILPPPSATFDAKRPPRLSAQPLNHAIRIQQMKKQSRKPQLLQPILAEAPSAIVMPAIEVHTPNVREMHRDTAPGIADIGQFDRIGPNGNSPLGKGQSSASFFDTAVSFNTVTICLDVSPSMLNKGVTQAVLEETQRLLADMKPYTRFNLITYVNAARAFSPQPVYATQENKTKALKWLEKPPHPGSISGYSGSTPQRALQMAVDMGADTIFVLADDPPYLKKGTAKDGVELTSHMDDIEKYVRNIESSVGHPVRIYPILYKPHANARGKQAIDYFNKLAKQTGGTSQVIKKTDPSK